MLYSYYAAKDMYREVEATGQNNDRKMQSRAMATLAHRRAVRGVKAVRDWGLINLTRPREFHSRHRCPPGLRIGVQLPPIGFALAAHSVWRVACGLWLALRKTGRPTLPTLPAVAPTSTPRHWTSPSPSQHLAFPKSITTEDTERKRLLNCNEGIRHAPELLKTG